MKMQTINRMIFTIAICGMGFMPAYALAGQDELQRQMIQRVQQAKLKLKEAEAAKGAERQKLMGEHMKMMQENMEKMRAMEPRAGMTMQEHEDWINEHQKLMEEMMGQMMKEHHLLMDMGDACKR
jgi:hypothetical protein